ncbi:hypothetical protein KM043_018447 [Ampulex compressa]|nr:hypothetical protein KM043_018447 [Ampulex compressa]
MHRPCSVAVLLSILGLCALCHAEFTDCGSDVGRLKSVDVTGCEDKTQCVLKRGTNVTIEIVFEPSKPATEVKAVVHGIIMDVPMPFPLPNADACSYPQSGITCPVQKDETYTYRAELPVKQSYPRLSLNVKWELRNEAQEKIVCVKIPAKIS